MIKFGTSGFRGVIAENFTKETVQKVAYALAKTQKTKHTISVGFDNRFLGKQFATWLIEVLTAYGHKVRVYAFSVPSPLIAYNTKNAELGIMITASHNPYYYSGIKLFSRGGREFTKEQNAVLEKLANGIKTSKIKTIPFDDALAQNLVEITDNIEPYCNSILQNVDASLIKKSGQIVHYNAMHGSSVECAKLVFKQLGIKGKFINTEVNPNFNFGLPAPYSHNLEEQKELVQKDKTENFGFALDGDGDRVSFLDENGTFYDCNYISALVYDEILKTQNSNFVKNCAMTSLLDKIAEKHGTKIVLAEVGFKNTAQKMLETPNTLLGAESNGIALQNHIPYKDGLMLAVKVMEVLARQKLPLSKAISALKEQYNFPCEVVEYAYPVTPEQRKQIEKVLFKDKVLPVVPQKNVVATSYADGLKIVYNNGYWGVLRFSGNENVIRLFAEMENFEECEKTILAYENLLGLKIKQK